MTATYRLQLHAGFTFADAEQVVPYVADLGATHLYLSPVLAAVPGSMHGYDVVDHTRVSDELGGQDGLERLADRARQHGLGLVVDVVPNHMALVAPLTGNAPLWQLLAEGPGVADRALVRRRLGRPRRPDRAAADVGHARRDGRGGPGRARRARRPPGRPPRRPPVPGAPRAPRATTCREVLARQHYLLAGWREKDRVLNYRRFFDVDSLIAVRVEDPDVFEATHRVLLDLNHRGVVEGFRIDHPDGLADPEGYLRALRRATRVGTAIWVEKILEGDEQLPTVLDVRRHHRLRRAQGGHRRARRPDDRAAGRGDLAGGRWRRRLRGRRGAGQARGGRHPARPGAVPPDPARRGVRARRRPRAGSRRP